jgi:hypothetical protein
MNWSGNKVYVFFSSNVPSVMIHRLHIVRGIVLHGIHVTRDIIHIKFFRGIGPQERLQGNFILFPRLKPRRELVFRGDHRHEVMDRRQQLIRFRMISSALWISNLPHIEASRGFSSFITPAVPHLDPGSVVQGQNKRPTPPSEVSGIFIP